jgi:hypothetical protein
MRAVTLYTMPIYWSWNIRQDKSLLISICIDNLSIYLIDTYRLMNMKKSFVKPYGQAPAPYPVVNGQAPVVKLPEGVKGRGQGQAPVVKLPEGVKGRGQGQAPVVKLQEPV